MLDEVAGVVVLSDRRMPRSRATVPLIAVSPGGVFVIDARHQRGLVHTKHPGSLGRLGRPELHVGRHDCTDALVQVQQQGDAVRAALAATPWGDEVPVQPMLCLTRAEWGCACALVVDGVWVGWPRLVPPRLAAPVVMDSPGVAEVSRMIADRMPAP